MAKNKFYAVKKGNKTGVFSTWEECQDATRGYPNAEFKSFITFEEAQAYLDDVDIVMQNDIIPRLKENRVVAFTDGSYEDTKKYYGSGVYLFLPDGRTKEISIKGNNPKFVNERNIAGEVIAVFNAVDWVLSNGYDKLTIFYDLQGIGEWASGNWRTNTNCSQFFQKFILDKKDVLDIEFQKVKGHSNNIYNNKADKLAKGAILENKIFQDNENSGYIINNTNEDKIDNLMSEITSEYAGLKYTKTKEQNKIRWVVQLDDSRLNVSFFPTTKKLLVQGKVSTLFKMFTTLLIEYLNCDNFIQILKNAYKIKIDVNSVNNSYDSLLPNIPKTISPNLDILLKQAIIDLNDDKRNDVDYTKYVFAALKALEAVLKFNLDKCLIPMSSNSFTMFDKDSTGVYILQPTYRSKISGEKAQKIENCYNHYYNQRHTLFHFGIVIGGKDLNTRLIKTKEEANNLINDTLKIINDNYIC